MTRRKVVLKYIQEHSKRKATFRKRKNGLIKKVQELSTLCDIEACVIVYGEDSNEAVVWPSPEEVQTVLAKFQAMEELEQNKRMFNQRSYLTERIVKAQEQLVKHQKDNRKKELTNLMHHCISIMKIPENLGENDMNDLNLLIDQNLLQIDRQIKNLMQKQAGEGSSGAAQQQAPMDIDHVQGVGAAMPPFGNSYEYGSSSGQGVGAAMPPFGNFYEYGASSGQGGYGAQIPPFGNNINEYGALSGQIGGGAQMPPFGNNVYEYGASSGQGGGGAQMPPFGSNVYEYGASSGQGSGGAQMPPFGNNVFEYGVSSSQGGGGVQMPSFGNNDYEQGALSGQGGGAAQMPPFGNNVYESCASNDKGGNGIQMPQFENFYGPGASSGQGDGGAEMPPSENVFGVPNGQEGRSEVSPFENDCVLPSGPWPYYPNRCL